LAFWNVNAIRIHFKSLENIFKDFSKIEYQFVVGHALNVSKSMQETRFPNFPIFKTVRITILLG